MATAPAPFPIPADFPVEWPSPELATMTWRQDRMHVPFPMTPMSEWWAKVFARGFTNGFKAYSVPMRTDILRINTYFYLGVNPSVPPEAMPGLEAKAAPLMQAAAARAWDRWEGEWLPELKRGWEAWAAVPLAALTDAELLAQAERGMQWYERIWTIHFELLLPVMLGASLFEELYTDLFPDRGPLTAYKLLQGFDSMSLEAGRELWLIAHEAATDPGLRSIIESEPVASLWAALDSTGAGRKLREKLSAYLAVYGRRSDNVQELSATSWTEDPSPALANLKAYINDPVDPRELLARHSAEREAALAETRASLVHYPQAARDGFEALLRIAQSFGRIQEDHNFWIDQRGTHETRQLCMEFGKRLADRGLLAAPSDVFLLSMDEAMAALSGKLDGVPAVTTKRRAEMDRWAKIAPAPIVGMDYGAPPDNPMFRAMSRFLGGPPPAATTPNELRGNTGSPGKVSGIARVVMSIDESGKLHQGEILVAPTTAPPWTPLFATAGGIVTETGGVLSHCAIVAREYGIPAVVGAPGATQLIRDGMSIEVDGDGGTVRILG